MWGSIKSVINTVASWFLPAGTDASRRAFLRNAPATTAVAVLGAGDSTEDRDRILSETIPQVLELLQELGNHRWYIETEGLSVRKTIDWDSLRYAPKTRTELRDWIHGEIQDREAELRDDDPERDSVSQYKCMYRKLSEKLGLLGDFRMPLDFESLDDNPFLDIKAPTEISADLLSYMPSPEEYSDLSARIRHAVVQEARNRHYCYRLGEDIKRMCSERNLPMNCAEKAYDRMMRSGVADDIFSGGQNAYEEIKAQAAKKVDDLQEELRKHAADELESQIRQEQYFRNKEMGYVKDSLQRVLGANMSWNDERHCFYLPVMADAGTQRTVEVALALVLEKGGVADATERSFFREVAGRCYLEISLHDARLLVDAGDGIMNMPVEQRDAGFASLLQLSEFAKSQKTAKSLFDDMHSAMRF